jgi:hypothetical protein
MSEHVHLAAEDRYEKLPYRRTGVPAYRRLRARPAGLLLRAAAEVRR